MSDHTMMVPAADAVEVLPAAAAEHRAMQERIYLEQQAAEIKALAYRLAKQGGHDPADRRWPVFDEADLVQALRHPCRIVTTRSLRERDGQSVVYALSDPRNHEIFYVGKSRQILKRLAAHCLINPQYQGASPLAKRKYAVYQDGTCVAAFLLQACEGDEPALAWEQFFIDVYHRTLLNVQLKRWLPRQSRYEW